MYPGFWLDANDASAGADAHMARRGGTPPEHAEGAIPLPRIVIASVPFLNISSANGSGDAGKPTKPARGSPLTRIMTLSSFENFQLSVSNKAFTLDRLGNWFANRNMGSTALGRAKLGAVPFFHLKRRLHLTHAFGLIGCNVAREFEGRNKAV